jgi:glycine cleavage system H lipoate-binding protein
VLNRRKVTADELNFCSLYKIEPKTINEACKYYHWLEDMMEEIMLIEKNQTWELVPRPMNKNIIGSNWVFKNKLNENEVVRNKARLVWKG